MTLKEQLNDKKALYQAYLQAEMIVLTGQRYRIGSRELQRADIQFIQAEREKLSREIRDLEAAITGKGKRKAYRITPRDL